MRTLPITVEKKARTYHIKFDADRFERVASALGMFSDDFLASIDRAEKDVRAGRVHRLKSLADLR
jgi:hypothetical protein